MNADTDTESNNGERVKCDLAIVGGGTGGVAGALSALSLGRSVTVIEETDWIGGQLTSQAVPADEHPWVERFGCTASYRRFRSLARSLFRKEPGLTNAARMNDTINPGRGRVSSLCVEPRIAHQALVQMLDSTREGNLRLLLRHRLESAELVDDRVVSLSARNLETGALITIEPSVVLEASDFGDLIASAGLPYRVGAESQSETGELHAVDGPAEPDNVQAFSWCMALGYDPSRDRTIKKPSMYEFWKSYRPELDPPWPGPLFGWEFTMPVSFKTVRATLFPSERGEIDAWTFRRVRAREHFTPEQAPPEITIMNWSQNDYLLRSPVELDDDGRRSVFEESRQMALSYLHYLQTEAPRPDGGFGYPGLFPAGDTVGTDDGLAKAPYIREGRRMTAEFTVTEKHVGKQQRDGRPAEHFHDSVGIGYYRIDLHPSTNGRHYINVSSLPFQVPLRSLLPRDVSNVIAAGKAMGTTHITNGCYRVHPVEWNVGEVAGYAAAWCVERRIAPHDLLTDRWLQDFQSFLDARGVEREWPQSVTNEVLQEVEPYLHT